MVKEYTAKPIVTEKYLLGESPYFDRRYDRLSWVDIIAGKFYTKTGDEISCFDFGEPVGAAIPLKDEDGYLVAGKTALWKYAGGRKEEVFALGSVYEAYQRSNDAKADPMGRVFVGSCTGDDDHEPSGDLYRFSDGKIVRVQEKTKIANGMAWNKDRTKFFFSDSLEHGVLVYDYDEATGNISNRRKLFSVEEGVPDGMTIDSDDRLWLAVWDGSRIECHDCETGELLAVVRVPALHTTSCCFFGENEDTLFITSSGNDLNGEFDGCLFECKVDAKGADEPFAVI
ncbi:MAG: SMP-30/gluconolactonase/LRE family protein [Butyrivibrio sp.]|nr:SMP-30/gluconolactonase/LRE family protein [Butyrivibrio sp.]